MLVTFFCVPFVSLKKDQVYVQTMCEVNKFLVVFHLLVLDLPRERPIVTDREEGSIHVARACSNKWYQSSRSS